MSWKWSESSIREGFDEILQSWWVGPIWRSRGGRGTGETGVHGSFQYKNLQTRQIDVLIWPSTRSDGAGRMVTALRIG